MSKGEETSVARMAILCATTVLMSLIGSCTYNYHRYTDAIRTRNVAPREPRLWSVRGHSEGEIREEESGDE